MPNSNAKCQFQAKEDATPQDNNTCHKNIIQIKFSEITSSVT